MKDFSKLQRRRKDAQKFLTAEFLHFLVISFAFPHRIRIHRTRMKPVPNPDPMRCLKRTISSKTVRESCNQGSFYKLLLLEPRGSVSVVDRELLLSDPYPTF